MLDPFSSVNIILMPLNNQTEIESYLIKEAFINFIISRLKINSFSN